MPTLRNIMDSDKNKSCG